MRRDGGFTLVESLVAMVVISVGMLGIAAMYVEGLRAGRTSVYRTIAIDLASDMADRIRANSTGRLAYDDAGDGVESGCVNGNADCAPDVLAVDDIFWWQQSVQSLLPGGAGDISVGAMPGGELFSYTITINWSEPGVDTPLQYAVAVQL